MKKFLALIALLLAASLIIPACADVFLPASLTVIEEEAFMGDSSLSGVVSVPAKVEQIQKDAFSETNLFGLEIPENVQAVNPQSFNNAAYVLFRGSSTTVDSLFGVRYIIAPEKSPAMDWAKKNNLESVTLSALVSHNGFYYRNEGYGLTLMSAIDPDSLESEVQIPEEINNLEVIAVSSFAFMRCTKVQKVTMPVDLLKDWNQSEHDEYAGMAFSEYTDPLVKMVRANVASGAVGNDVTWTVETEERADIVSYTYSLYQNGTVIDETTSSNASYTGSSLSEGAYQLKVVVIDRSGARGAGSSSVLYIAAESMKMNVPQTIQAGQDLTLRVLEVPGAYFYGVYLSDESTGKTLNYVTVDKAEEVTFEGYMLDSGTYRVTGYVFGNDFRFTVPTVRTVTVSGTKAAGPEIENQETYNSRNDFSVPLSDAEKQAISFHYRFADNTAGEEHIEFGEYDLWAYPYGENEYKKLESDGGTLLIKRAIKANCLWSAWGPTAEIEVLPAPKLATPTITCLDTAEAGKDLTFCFESVENANYYNVYLYPGNNYENSSYLYWEQYRNGQTAIIPGYVLDAGQYTLYVYAESISGEYSSSSAERHIVVSGTRPTAPTVTADKTERYLSGGNVQLTIQSPGADGAYIKRKFTKNGHETNYGYGVVSISLDENGNGTYRDTYNYNEDLVGYTLTYQVASIQNGVWSEFGSVEVLLKKPEPLSDPVIIAPESHTVGTDYSFQFNPVDGADYYEVRFRQYYNDSSIYSWYHEEAIPSQDLIVPGYYLTQGNYRIQVTAYSAERGNSSKEVSVQMVGSREQWTQPTISSTEVLPDDNFTFEFITSGIGEIRYRLYYNGDNNWSRNGTINVYESTTRWTTSIGTAGEYYYIFSARINDHWTAWTSPVYITVIDEGTMVLPDVDLSDILPLGQDLTVTVGSMEKSRNMYVRLYNSNDTRVGSKYLSGNMGGTVTFDGYSLSLGINRVEVEIYTGNNWYYIKKQFTVTNNARPQAPEVTPDTDVGRANVRFGFTVNSSGADKIAVRYYQEDNTNNIYYDTKNSTGDETYWYHTCETSGTIWKYAFSVQVNDTWSPWSQNYTVRISNREQLSNTAIHAESNIEAGQDLYVSFNEVDNAEFYTMYLEYPNGNHSYWDSAIPNTERRFVGYDLTPGTYRIVVTASSIEYESSTTEKTIRVTGTRPAAPEVHVSSHEVFPDETFTFVIDSAGAEEIAYRSYYTNGGYNSGTLSVWMISDPTVWETSTYGSGNMQYSFSTLKDGKWSAWSTPIEITVKTRPALDAPVVTVPGSITQGENLTVTVGAVENAISYYVYLYDNRERQISYKSLNSAGSVTFSGYRLPLGSLRVFVEVYGSNSGASKASKNVTVEIGAQSDSPFVTPPESLTVNPRTYYTFAINTENAEKAAVRYFRIGSPNDMYYSEFNVDDGETTSWRGYQYNSGCQYAYSFSVQRDGIWSVWSPFTVISIE